MFLHTLVFDYTYVYVRVSDALEQRLQTVVRCHVCWDLYSGPLTE